MSFGEPKESQFENLPTPAAEKPEEELKTELSQKIALELRKKVLNENFEVPESITEERNKELKEEIDNVANIFERASRPWFLSGGIALELHSGELKRDHHDQDVLIYEEDRQAFVEAIKKSGYDFFIPSPGKEDDLAVKKQITTERNFHLKKIDKHIIGPSDIDLDFLQKEKGGEGTIWDENVTLSRNLLENARQYTSNRGREVSLIPKEVLIYNKILEGRQLDFYDLKASLPTLAEEERQRLDGYLKKSGVSFVVAGRETRNIDELMQLAETETKDVKKNFLIPEIDKIDFKNYDADMQKILEIAKQANSQKEFLNGVENEFGKIFSAEQKTLLNKTAQFLFGDKKPTLEEFQEFAHRAINLPQEFEHKLKVKALDMPRWEIRTADKNKESTKAENGLKLEQIRKELDKAFKKDIK